MAIDARRKRFKTLAHTVLAALAIQFAAGPAPGACTDMSASGDSHALHTPHSDPVMASLHTEGSLGASGSDSEHDAQPCGCPTSEPPESQGSHSQACPVAMHCVSSPAVVPEAGFLAVPVRHEQTVAGPTWSAHSVALSHPTPPPRS